MNIRRTAPLLILAISLLGLVQSSMAVIVNPANGNGYDVVFSNNPTWTDARNAAAALTFSGTAGHLATFTTRAEQEFVITNFGGGIVVDRLWLGGFQDTSAADFSENYGGWRWVTGETWVMPAEVPPGTSSTAPRSDFGFNNSFFDGSSEEFTITWWETGGINDYTDTPSANSVSGFPAAPSRGFIVEFESNSVPEPTTLALLGLGLAGIGFRRRKVRSKLKIPIDLHTPLSAGFLFLQPSCYYPSNDPWIQGN